MVERQWSNHKYIRKEGNRYIYPEDLKKTPRQRKLMTGMSLGEKRVRMQDGSLDRMRGQVTQEAAKKQGEFSKRIMRQEKAAEEMRNQRRKEVLNSQGSGLGSARARKQISSNHADQMKEIREIARMEKNEKRKKALNSQGSSNTQQNAKSQGEFSKKMMRQEREHDARDQIWRGTSAQEAAKKQGKYSKSMMRKEKTRQSRTKGSDFVNRRLNRR